MSSTEENKKENRHSKILSWIGTIAGIIGLIVTIIVSVKKNEPKLEYTIVSKVDFFNNSEPVPYIKVFLEDSINVQENHYNITAYSIKVENKGTKHIKYSDYDEGFFGLKVDNGTLLDAPVLLSASDNHIEDIFCIDSMAKGSSEISLPHISLDIDNYYTIKIVLLHNVDSIPLFYPKGKITGQKSIEITEMQKTTTTFWSEVFSGGGAVQIVRLLSYFFLFALIIEVIDLISELKHKKWVQRREMEKESDKKKRENDEMKKREDEIKELTSLIPTVKKEYINNGEDDSLFFLALVFKYDDETEISKKYRKLHQYIMRNKNNFDSEEYKRVKREYDRFNYYIEQKYFILNGDLSITFDKDAKESVIKLFDYLRGKKEDKYKSIDEIIDTK